MFLNVDVDLVSRTPIDALRQELTARAVVLRDTCEEGKTTLSFEVLEQTLSPEECIVHVHALYRSLSAPLRRAWDECESRVLDIGVAHQEGRHSFALGLGQACLAQVAAMGCTVRLTLYGTG
jgi:hypothetical protein